MARLHFAYGFDAAAVVESLCAGAPALPDALRAQARAAARRPGATLREALGAVRFSDDWLGDDPDEADRDAKAFLVWLLARCTPVPSLGRAGEPPHHVVLAALLADAGWTAADIGRLMRGDPPSAGLMRAGLAALVPSLGGLDDLTGWLDHEGARTLLAGLAAVQGYFERESARHEVVLARIVPAWGADATVMAAQACERAQAMLATVDAPGRGLLLVLD